MICIFNFSYAVTFTYRYSVLYLLLNSCDGMTRNNVFSSVDCWWRSEKSWLFCVLALRRAGFNLADVQSDVILPSRLHVIAFSIDQLLCR